MPHAKFIEKKGLATTLAIRGSFDSVGGGRIIADPNWGGGGRNQGHHCLPPSPLGLSLSVDPFLKF
ncbi:hypothetical protein CRG98_000515 [Punica granatum]|uniref:Uncharacterized protein n=1 Tax=Punica granatum TaxID=22663 RepID=A0A2I0LEZ1_PUNGR|nr:hypothetical protein CRG98_000515 [Punica granatum]